MKRITDKELEKLSISSDVPVDQLSKLHSLGVLNEVKVIDFLIRQDYLRIRKSGKYTVRQIVAAIRQEYDVPLGRVNSVIYDKYRKEAICQVCGREVLKSELKRNAGKCNECRIKEIPI